MFAIVDNDPALLDYLRQFKWKSCYKSNNRSNYVATRSAWQAGRNRSKTVYMHREVLEFYGVAIDGLQVDHKNRRTLDNRKDNLRPATNMQNHANMPVRKHNVAGYKGVIWQQKATGERWHSQIRINGKQRLLGVFPSAELAAARYNLEAIRLVGEFAYLNVIPGDPVWVSHNPKEISLPEDPSHLCYIFEQYNRSKKTVLVNLAA